MKKNKLRKISIDLLQEKMYVLDGKLQKRTIGGYENDCFWRCIAYIASNGTAYGEIDAERHADAYFGPEAGLYYYGSAIPNSEMNAYVDNHFSSDSPFNLIQFDPNKVPGMSAVYGLTHVAVFQEDIKDSSGYVTGFRVIDPQQNISCIVPRDAALDIMAPDYSSPPNYGQW